MKTIKQRGENDCGVACVAMLTSVPYDEAKRVVYGTGRPRLTKTKELHRALQALGRMPQTERRQQIGKKVLLDLYEDALVFVEGTNNGITFKHWIVWDARKRIVRDPYHTKKRYRLRGYLSMGNILD